MNKQKSVAFLFTFALVLVSLSMFSAPSLASQPFANKSLVGTWETSDGKDKWVFSDDGTAELIQDSTNRNAGVRTTVIDWTADMERSQLTYTVTRVKLEGTPRSDYNKPVRDGKKNTVSFTLEGNQLMLGSLIYIKK